MLTYIYQYLYSYPDFIAGGYARQLELPGIVTVEIWTKYGETGDVTMKVMGADYAMVKQPDSVNGNNHFKANSAAVG